jgi:hypothetical protein
VAVGVSGGEEQGGGGLSAPKWRKISWSKADMVRWAGEQKTPGGKGIGLFSRMTHSEATAFRLRRDMV